MTPSRLLAPALAWLRTHVHSALNPHYQVIDTTNPAPPNQTALVELPLLCRALRHPEVRDQLTSEATADTAHLLGIVTTTAAIFTNQPPVLNDPLYPYRLILIGLLKDCGQPINDLGRHQALARLGHGHLNATARPGSAALEMRWAKSLVGVQESAQLPSTADLYHREVLAQEPDLARVTDYEAYLATHVIFYLTDIARTQWPPELGNEWASATAWIQQLLALYLCESHWDLVAELMICWRALGLDSSDLTDEVWRCLVTAQTADGAVPGPRPRADNAPRQQADPMQDYHTTLVTALAAAIWTAPPATRPLRPLPQVSTIQPDNDWWIAVSSLIPYATQTMPINRISVDSYSRMGSLVVGPSLLRASRAILEATCRALNQGTLGPIPDVCTYLPIRAASAARQGDLTLAIQITNTALAKWELDSVTRSTLQALACIQAEGPLLPRQMLHVRPDEISNKASATDD